MSSDAAQHIVGKALSGVSFLASAQLLSRALTFILNVALTRHLDDASTLGVASVQLYLLYTIVLTLSREGVRRTCLRVGAPSGTASGNADRANGSARTRSSMVNLTWIVVMGGLVLTTVFSWWFVAYADVDALGTVSLDEYVDSILLIGVALVVELLSEPMFVAAQGQLQYGVRSFIEGAAVLGRCLVTVFAVVGLGLRLQAFALGYIAYSVILLGCYFAFFVRQVGDGKENEYGVWTLTSMRDLLPGNGLRITDGGISTVAVSMSFQQIWKLILAEGEKMVMVMLKMEASDLAVYALVFNLGSLVARFVFQPIEETAFAVFGKLNDIAGKMDSQNKDHHLSVGALVGTLCKTMCIIGLTFVTFGPSYSHLLLHLLYGNKWSNQTDAPRALGVYCVYVLIIAVNGITEAFVHAIGDKKSLQDFNAWLFLFSLIYLGAAAVLLPFRAVGLILANCINMGMRILFSTNFILKWEDPVSKQRVDSIRQLCPSLQTLFAFSSSAVAVSVSETTVYHAFASWPRAGAHVAIGAVALVSTFAFLVFVSEKKYVANLRDLRRALAGKSG